MRRRRALAAVGLALAALVAACGSRQDAYCDTVHSKQASLSKQIGGGGKAALLEALPTFRTLEDKAPADIQPQWRIVVTALSGLQQALDGAHVDAATYDRDAAGLSAAQKGRIDAAAAQLGTARVVDALQAVAQESRDVCHTPLTLG